MALPSWEEGKIPFNLPSTGLSCFTFYKVFGNLKSDSTPLICIHGGPGAGHEYLLPFAQLWADYHVPVIFYDQIGCASSTHLPQLAGDESFWQESLFIAELDNLIRYLKLDRYHLLGQSWGGMLAATFAARQPPGLQRLILASALASTELSSKGIQKLREQLPADVQLSLDKAEKDGNYDSPEHRSALLAFFQRFLCRLDPLPETLMPALTHLGEDKTVYSTM